MWEGRREGWKEGGKEGRREGGMEGRKEGGKEGKRYRGGVGSPPNKRCLFFRERGSDTRIEWPVRGTYNR